MDFDITPITGALGADVHGIDLCGADEETLHRLNSALDQHLVLRLRGQNLDRFQLSKFARSFGPPFLHPLVNNGFEDCPDVLELLRTPNDAEMFGGESWHADISWMKPAGYASILHAKELPPTGGDTCFSSTIAAFSAMSPAFQEMLRGLEGVHAYHWYEQREEPPWVATHPVVRRNPRTEQEGLYINRMFTSRFNGMTVAESQPLLAQLFDHMEQHQFTCRFQWAKGSIAFWDNRRTWHQAVNDYHGERRLMHRITLEGVSIHGA